MQSIAGFLLLMGAGSFVLNLMGMEFVLLAWIDMWGPTIGMWIRIGMIAGGIGLFILGAMLEGDSGGDDDDLSREAMRRL